MINNYEREYELKKLTTLNEVEISDVIRLKIPYLIERHIKQISIDEQIEIISEFSKTNKTLGHALKLILANFNQVIVINNTYHHLVRLFCSKHSTNKYQTFTGWTAISILKYFDEIDPGLRNQMIELLVLNRTSKTDRPNRKLFHRKFNYLPINKKNEVLKKLIQLDNCPAYYLTSFLMKKKKDVSAENKDLILKNLASRYKQTKANP